MIAWLLWLESGPLPDARARPGPVAGEYGPERAAVSSPNPGTAPTGPLEESGPGRTEIAESHDEDSSVTAAAPPLVIGVGRVQFVDRISRRPVPGLVVEATYGRIWNREYQTDEQGWIELRDSAICGPWTLSLVDPEQPFSSLEPGFVWSDPKRPAEVELHVPRAFLRLEVRGPTGLPVAGATVDLARLHEGRAQRFQTVTSDSKGKVLLPWPPAGEQTEGWFATARHLQEGASLVTRIADPAAQPVTVLQLDTGARLELRVTDPARNPFPHVEVRLRATSLAKSAFVQQLRGTRDYLDSRGSRVWPQLAAGEYELSLRSPVGVGWLRRTVRIDHQDQIVEWVLEQDPEPIALAGRLQVKGARSTHPAVGHYIELVEADTGELIAGSRSDAEGGFILFGKASGEVLLRTNLVDQGISFEPHEHRFDAGTRSVHLIGRRIFPTPVQLRIISAATGDPVPNARLKVLEQDLESIAGHSNAQGLLIAEVIPDRRYAIESSGFVTRKLPARGAAWDKVIELEPIFR